MSGKTTAKDVALAANVSPATVDRVINNRGGVSAEKEKRVLDAARKLGLDRALDHRAARTLRISVLIQPPENPYHASLQTEFESANQVFRNFNIQFRVCHVDPTKPAAMIRTLREVSPTSDGLVVCGPHDDEFSSLLDRLTTRGMPVIALATDIRGVSDHIYIGPDNRRAGRVAGDLMGRLIGRTGGDVLVIAGMLSMIGHEEREMGFRSVLRERYANCRVLEVVQSFENRARAGDLVGNALRTNPAIRGIYNASAGSASIVDVLKRLDLVGEVVFITHELTEERQRLLRAGLIDAVIDQNPRLEVRTVVETLAHRFGRLDQDPPNRFTPILIHMIENSI